MKNHNYRFLLVLLASFVFVMASCTSDDPEIEKEQEIITDVTLIFTEVDNSNNPIGNPFEFKASDPQGLELGNNPTIETIQLAVGKRYLLEIELFNSIENEDITEEIIEEADEHQFYFLGTAFVGSPILTYTYADADKNGNPIGLKGYVQVNPAPGFNNAQFRLVLRHDHNKNFNGATNPNWQDFVLAGGETDLDITFPLVLNP
ncbi:hypothetical protein [Cecembia rubra]|nr:hypothetical protein [Cecembia rubra]